MWEILTYRLTFDEVVPNYRRCLVSGKTPNDVCCPNSWPPSFVAVVRPSPHHISQERFNVRRTSKLYTNIHTNRFNSYAGYEAASYFRSAVIAKKRPKMTPPTALGWIWVAWRFALPNQLVGFLLTPCVDPLAYTPCLDWLSWLSLKEIWKWRLYTEWSCYISLSRVRLCLIRWV